MGQRQSTPKATQTLPDHVIHRILAAAFPHLSPAHTALSRSTQLVAWNAEPLATALCSRLGTTRALVRTAAEGRVSVVRSVLSRGIDTPLHALTAAMTVAARRQHSGVCQAVLPHLLLSLKHTMSQPAQPQCESEVQAAVSTLVCAAHHLQAAGVDLPQLLSQAAQQAYRQYQNTTILETAGLGTTSQCQVVLGACPEANPTLLAFSAALRQQWSACRVLLQIATAQLADKSAEQRREELQPRWLSLNIILMSAARDGQADVCQLVSQLQSHLPLHSWGYCRVPAMTIAAHHGHAGLVRQLAHDPAYPFSAVDTFLYRCKAFCMLPVVPVTERHSVRLGDLIGPVLYGVTVVVLQWAINTHQHWAVCVLALAAGMISLLMLRPRWDWLMEQLSPRTQTVVSVTVHVTVFALFIMSAPRKQEAAQ